MAFVALALAPALTQAYVYWANDDTADLGRADLDGTGVNQSFVNNVSPHGVAVDASSVYWTGFNVNTVGRANLDGTGVITNLITGGNVQDGVAVDSNYIYWTNFPTDSIGRANLDGTGAVTNFISGASDPRGVAVDGSYVYWSNFNTNRIGRANLDGTGANQSFITGLNLPFNLAVDSNYIYWANIGTDTIGRANLDGTGVATNFITGASSPIGVAVDANYIYWTNFGAHTIGRANLDGSGVNQSFITVLGAPRGVAVDGLPAPPPDTTAPTITITTPPDDASYTLGQPVLADYACEDEAGGSGLAFCTGTVADGAAIDTGSVGPKAFAVDTEDNAGNPAQESHDYSVVYTFSGFFPPVDNPPTLNQVKGGSAVPVKFSLGGDQGLDILAAGYPRSESIACGSNPEVDGIEETVTAGSSSLSYDPSADQYVYVWKTAKSWANTCRQLVVKLNDDTAHRANFKFK